MIRNGGNYGWWISLTYTCYFVPSMYRFKCHVQIYWNFLKRAFVAQSETELKVVTKISLEGYSREDMTPISNKNPHYLECNLETTYNLTRKIVTFFFFCSLVLKWKTKRYRVFRRRLSFAGSFSDTESSPLKLGSAVKQLCRTMIPTPS